MEKKNHQFFSYVLPFPFKFMIYFKAREKNCCLIRYESEKICRYIFKSTESPLILSVVKSILYLNVKTYNSLFFTEKSFNVV